MTIAIELPPELTHRLEDKWGDLSRHTLELLAIQAYKDELLTAAQLRRLLGFKTRMEVDGFLKQHSVYLEYTTEDFDRERELHHQLLNR